MNKRIMNFYIDSDIYDYFKDMKDEYGASIAYQINKALRSYISSSKVNKAKKTQANSTRLASPDALVETSNKNEVIDDDFLRLWELYPKKEGRKAALQAFKSSVKTKDDLKEIYRAILNYIEKIKVEEIPPQFVKHGGTFFGNWKDYVNYSPVSPKNKIVRVNSNNDLLKSFVGSF